MFIHVIQCDYLIQTTIIWHSKPSNVEILKATRVHVIATNHSLNEGKVMWN